VIYFAAIMSCTACGSAIPGTARFCPSCGIAVDFGATATLEPEAAPRVPGSPGASPRKPGSTPRISSSSDSFDGARFIPGTVLEDRYRIVAMAGRGGMGEVYRAEDLKLSQAVALKFLPEFIAQDGAALARFHREVRIARQVSHPNVCRVFDIGEADGLPFLTMEYVDGEDLATLLRRIGHLPSGKAIEIARQICAGLAAAHDHGVIHRDLKPANVMIDGRGKVRLTDFGLAGVAGSFKPEESGAGTPAYMAPEQLAGKDASVQSDIYALGLVLYEVFTGKRAFEATTLAELRRQHELSSPTKPSLLVKDVDPIVERVVLRCLEKDPGKRPTSALQVAAVLPGGDPLAAALAAGETPSPEMVAASGESEGLRPLVAWILLGGAIVSVTAVILLSAQTMLYRRVPLEKPPEALAEQARNILESVGYSEPPTDTAMGFSEGTEFLRYIAEHDRSKTRWNNLETGAFVFWYRASPRPLAARYFFSDAPMLGFVWTDDPPLEVSGMTLVRLNPLGRLTQFVAVPPQVEQSAGAASSPNWAPLFSAAGLDPSKWTSAQSMWTPPVYSDARAAWTGSLAERPDIPMRIEATAYRGKPVYFELIGPWTRPERMQPYQLTVGERASEGILMILLLSMLLGGAMLARRNLRLGRGDRRGASRLAAFVFAAWAVAWLFGAHHVPNFGELWLLLESVAWGLALSSFLWVLYVALEPYVRRRWPATLVSWSRLLAGGFRDPLVGRDLLIGCLSGASSTAVGMLLWFVPSWLGHASPVPLSGPNWQFLGARAIIADQSISLVAAPTTWLGFLFVVLLLRTSLRKGWLAAVAGALLLGVVDAGGNQFAPAAWVFGLVFGSLVVFLLIRFGLLVLVANYVIHDVLVGFPLTTQGSAWYAGLSLAGILLMAAIALYGFHTSLGGRPVFGGAVIEE
jgi:eukaryotic-like serine/threonine-protein kinase